jgi:hypothetical protein
MTHSSGPITVSSPIVNRASDTLMKHRGPMNTLSPREMLPTPAKVDVTGSKLVPTPQRAK